MITNTQNQEEEIDPLDLLNAKTIPLQLHEDQTLTQYICAINTMPIRDPVQDPTAKGTNPVLYERKSIIKWLKDNNTSPITRDPLQISQLIERTDIKNTIEGRLKFHQDKLDDYLKEMINGNKQADEGKKKTFDKKGEVNDNPFNLVKCTSIPDSLQEDSNI